MGILVGIGAGIALGWHEGTWLPVILASLAVGLIVATFSVMRLRTGVSTGRDKNDLSSLQAVVDAENESRAARGRRSLTRRQVFWFESLFVGGLTLLAGAVTHAFRF